MSLCVFVGRLCARWSRMMQPGNRGWPLSWSRWWPSWVWRAENHTSQGALGRDPVRNRAVPEWRPVPIFFFFHHVTSFLRLSEMNSSSNFFFCFLFPEKYCFFSPSLPSTLLHRLVYLNLCEGWPGAEFGVSHSAMWGIPQLRHREAWRGDCLKAGHIGNVSIPPAGRKEGKKTFLCCLQEFTPIGNSLKTTMLGVHFVENFSE